MSEPNTDLGHCDIRDGAVVLTYHSRIVAVSSIKKAAASLSRKAWITIDGDDDEVLVELRPKEGADSRALARQFDKALITESLGGLESPPSPALLARIGATNKHFIVEERGKVPKQAVVALGSILASLGAGSMLSEEVTASHMCSTGDGDGGDSDDGAPGCFRADQLVSTPTGSTPISALAVGDKVVSFSEEQDSFTVSTIGQVVVHDGKQAAIHAFNRHPLIELVVESGGQTETSLVTLNHPYFDPVENAYKQLDRFNVGDLVRTTLGTGRIVSMTSVIDQSTPAKAQNSVVYNLHMAEGPNNFLVNGVVVHNSDGGGKG